MQSNNREYKEVCRQKVWLCCASVQKLNSFESKFPSDQELASYFDCIFSSWCFNLFLTMLVDALKFKLLGVFLEMFHMADDL